MKKLASVLFSIIIAFSFVGCSNINLFNNEPLRIIDSSVINDEYLVDFDANDKYIVILHYSFEDEVTNMHLSLYDLRWSKILKTIDVNEDYCNVVLSDGEIQLWSDSNHYISYDFKLNNYGEKNGKYFNYNDLVEEIDTIDVNRFCCYDSMAYDTNYINYSLMIFYNDPQNYYLVDMQREGYILACYDKLVLENIESDESFELILKDYDSQKVINNLSIDFNENACYFSRSKLNEYCACFGVTDGEGRISALYYWDYRQNTIEEDFDCRVINDSECASELDELSINIKEKYGVNLIVSRELDDEESFIHKCIDNSNNARYLLCAYDLAYCLGTLPENVYREMLCKDIDNPVCTFEESDIYLVGEVADGNIDAYAGNVNEHIYIVYGCNAFNYLTFCHEMMHNMEYRIWNYKYDFDQEWQMCNPDGFEYSVDYSLLYYDNEDIQDYFARDYGIMSYLEDRATIFEMVSDELHGGIELWWAEKEPLKKKVLLLKDAIYNSFPSYSASDAWKFDFE